MTQHIEVTNVGDHFEMIFGDGGSSYPVPEHAIDALDDELVPDVDDSVRFEGEYGGHKHAKSFDVETVLSAPAADDGDEYGSDDDEDALSTEPLTEAEMDALEEGDLVRRRDDPQGHTRAVTKPGDENPLAGGRVFVEVENGTIKRDLVDEWEVVCE